MVGYYARVGEAIAFLILGVGFSGLNAVGYAVNHLDIAPRYAGILMGVSNTFASIPGFLSPMLTGHIAKNKVRCYLFSHEIISEIQKQRC